MVPKNKQITVHEGDYVRGEMIVDGNPVPHDILDIMGVEALAEYLVEEIQSVYRLQGVKINDKHIEVVDPPDAAEGRDQRPGRHHLPGGRDRRPAGVRERSTARWPSSRWRRRKARPVLQGITKASCRPSSFISAASFQETTRVLTEAAVYGKSDYLEGLKENVIVGRLIPAGTGATMNEYRKLASQRDRKLLAEREQREELAGGGDAEQSAAQCPGKSSRLPDAV